LKVNLWNNPNNKQQFKAKYQLKKQSGLLEMQKKKVIYLQTLMKLLKILTSNLITTIVIYTYLLIFF